MTDNLLQPLKIYGTDLIQLAYHPLSRQYLEPDFLVQHHANDLLQTILSLSNMGTLHSYLILDDPSEWGHGVKQERAESRFLCTSYI